MFCGTSNTKKINSVEKLAIHADPKLQVKKKWEVVIPKTNTRPLPALWGHISIPSNENEIVVFGGVNRRHANLKVHLYDSRTDSKKSVEVHGEFSFSTY